MSLIERIVAAIGVALPIAINASAASQRTLVASFGANTGTRTPIAPCRSFDYSIGRTAAGGR